jgi:gamma-glutamyltranspeptidase/glutathione hydrolase
MSRIAGLVVLAVLMALVAAFPAGAQVQAPPKTPTAVGSGGSAASVDPLATEAAIDVLSAGGNAVDAAVAAAGVLGVVEPFSCGIGGGGFMVIYDAKRGKVDTIDSREAAPAGLQADSFADFDPNDTAEFTAARVSGLSVGVPGTVAGWETALERYGSRSLRSLLRRGERIAREGFVIDPTFEGQVTANAGIFDDFTSTRDLYLVDGKTPKPAGETQYNPDLAETYERIGEDPDRFYRGRIARDIAETVQHPPEAPESDREVAAGSMTPRDLARYEAIRREPTKINYRGLDVYGMGPPSSGGTTVGEALNILEGFPMSRLPRERALHRYLEASKLAYADRNAYVADPDQPDYDVPVRGLLSDRFAAERRAKIGEKALPAPQPAGDPFKYDDGHSHGMRPSSDENARSTTHLTVADRWGNVVSYTFTIEQIGGNGMVVPGRGFLLNNELTDFNFAPLTPNSPAPGKRPRSSMAPTIVFDGRGPAVALGSPGGATIITTVLQTLVNYVDFGMSLPEAVAEPRASQRNGAVPTDLDPPPPPGTIERTEAEQTFIDRYGTALTKRGHYFTPVAPPGEIGTVAAIRFLDRGRQQAVAEPTRRGGGSAMVVSPSR